MFRKLRARLTYANVIASLALFIALGGTGYAASQLAKNSVGTKHLKSDAVTSPKVKNASLDADDFKPGELPAGPQGPAGPPGTAGTPGAPGERGERGPSDVYSGTQPPGEISLGPAAFTLNVPAGTYAVSASGAAFNRDQTDPFTGQPDAVATCGLSAAGDSAGDTATAATVRGVGYELPGQEAGGAASLAVNATFALGAAGSIVFQCRDHPFSDGPALYFTGMQVQAVRVGALHAGP